MRTRGLQRTEHSGELLNNPDGGLLKAQYKGIVEQKQKEYGQFVESNQKTLDRLLQLDSDYDLKNLKDKICNISVEQREHDLTLT